eukprot:tig00021682_g23093.t1
MAPKKGAASSAPQPDSSGSLFVLEAPDATGSLPKGLLQVVQGSVIRVIWRGAIGACKSGKPVLATNLPAEGDGFDRNTARVVSGSTNALGDAVFELRAHVAGTFDVALYGEAGAVGDGAAFREKAREVGTRVTVVSDVVVNGKAVPLEALAIQSVCSKLLGPVSDWTETVGKPAAAAGYSIVHFSPMETLSSGGSPYSISDRTVLSRAIFGAVTEANKQKALKGAVQRLEEECGVLSVADVVYGQTAVDTPWLQEHPECGYSSINSPHLAAAIALDEALAEFSAGMESQKHMVSPHLDNDGALNWAVLQFRAQVLAPAKLWQFYVVNVQKVLHDFRDGVINKRPFEAKFGSNPTFWINTYTVPILKESTASDGSRGGKGIDTGVLLALFNSPPINAGDTKELEHRCRLLTLAVDEVNQPLYQQFWADEEKILHNIWHTVHYERLDPAGPKKGAVTPERPFLDPYFTKVSFRDGRTAYFAHPGYLRDGAATAGDPADPKLGISNPYLLRQVAVTRGTVRLYYGKRREDNPWLWDQMADYTRRVAQTFHGVCLHEAHTTPLEVSEYMIDVARKARPGLVVLASMPLQSKEVATHYSGRIGMLAVLGDAPAVTDLAALAAQVRAAGGQPVGSLDPRFLIPGERDRFYRPLIPTPPAAVCCDSSLQARSTRNATAHALPLAAVCAMACGAVASARGFDELNDLTYETRAYAAAGAEAGIAKARAALNALRARMAGEHANEVDAKFDGGIFTVFRRNPCSHEGYFLVAPAPMEGAPAPPQRIPVGGALVGPALAARLEVLGEEADGAEGKTLKGLRCSLRTSESDYLGLAAPGADGKSLEIRELPAGSFLIVRVKLPAEAQAAVRSLAPLDDAELAAALNALSLEDMNVVLFRTAPEEKDTIGWDAYDVPDYGKLAYYGLQSFVAMLDEARLGRTEARSAAVAPPSMTTPEAERKTRHHPLVAHLRAGDWALEYLAGRLKATGLAGTAAWFEGKLAHIKALPRYLVAPYFDTVVRIFYYRALERCHALMGPFVAGGSDLVQRLAMTSVQLYGVVPSSPASPDRPKSATLAAGLPHFATGAFRAWGRDTFVALRGLLLVTGRFREARDLILAFGAALRHGLIPNLLDGGRAPRYNSRDACWWWLQAVQEYCAMAPNGEAILAERVERLFDCDAAALAERRKTFGAADAQQRPGEKSHTVASLVQEVLESHANGIHFREWEAPRVDPKLQDNAFNVDVTIDLATGIVYGGNTANAGTWMDKVGESQQAGNHGKPATPRDGAAVEIVGLVKSALRWVTALHKAGKFPYPGAWLQSEGRLFAYADWQDRLQASFEKAFYIPQNEAEDGGYLLEKQFVNRRGIYKDTFGSFERWPDYALRPNAAVAMVVAPELFDRRRAAGCLALMREHLLGPLGMRSLDPGDMQYRPNYDPQADSSEYGTARGFNYHQGPEWVWLSGYFLRAALAFGVVGREEALAAVAPHRAAVERGPYFGLPEVTNGEGAECGAACPTQAWSSAALLDLLHDLQRP